MTAHARLDRAEALCEGSESASAALVLAVSARIRFIADEPEEARRLAEPALALAELLDLAELRAHALTTVGMVKNGDGDTSGLEDMERALELALEVGSPIAATIVNNLAVEAFRAGELRRSRKLYEDSVQLAERLGDRESARFTGTNLVFTDFLVGDWDRAERALDRFLASCEAGQSHASEPLMHGVRGAIRRARGDARGASTDYLRALELARTHEDSINLLPSLAGCAAMYAERGDLAEARALMTEALAIIRETGGTRGVMQVVAFAERLGMRNSLLEAMDASPSQRTDRWREAERLALGGDLRAAADDLAQMGAVAIESYLRFHAGGRLIERGLPEEGRRELERALAFYRSVDASAYVAQIEAALAEAQSESA